MPLVRTAAGSVLALMLCATAQAQSDVVDGTGRTIRPPARVERVYAAGPPASLLVYAIAPDKLLGWTRALRPREAQFFDARAAALPELGRLTGRGNTANVEVVLGAKADLIVDVGFIAGTYTSLAERVQVQTGIPYALFDGRLEVTPATLRALGRLMGDRAAAEALAEWFESELAEIRRRVARVAPEEPPAKRRPRPAPEPRHPFHTRGSRPSARTRIHRAPARRAASRDRCERERPLPGPRRPASRPRGR